MSVHAGWAHAPVRHTPLAQSRPTTQRKPEAQGAQAPPPQSASVSEPDCTPSVHDASWHTPFRHWLPAQSLLTTHVLPAAQPGHVPPQSIPVSPWSEMRLVQCDAATPASVLTSKFGTEQDAATSPRTSSAWSTQCFGAAKGRAFIDPKADLSVLRWRANRARAAAPKQYVSTGRGRETPIFSVSRLLLVFCAARVSGRELPHPVHRNAQSLTPRVM
jgi:hypothetical protein